MNQCDGCMARKPLVNGLHKMGEDGKYPDWMVCEKHKYVRRDGTEGPTT